MRCWTASGRRYPPRKTCPSMGRVQPYRHPGSGRGVGRRRRAKVLAGQGLLRSLTLALETLVLDSNDRPASRITKRCDEGAFTRRRKAYALADAPLRGTPAEDRLSPQRAARGVGRDCLFPSACAESWLPGARRGKVGTSAERREAHCVRRRTQGSATTSNTRYPPQASGAGREGAGRGEVGGAAPSPDGGN